MSKTYQEYFNIDPKYYAAVTADLIESGKVSWKNFYPHETFVKLLERTHTVLSGRDPRSLWVEGAYGTGKSHAALTVKSLLDASDAEIEEYFKDYALSQDLCQKLITDKNGGKLITIHRIGSGSIRSDQDLILAVQDSITRALDEHGIQNLGESSLKDAALKWFEKKASRDYFAELISEEQYAWTFGGEKIDTIIEKLQNGTPEQVTKLMRNIITVAEDNGITALRLDIQGMAEWIKSVIRENNLKAILFVWDEFTEFFQNNPNSLTGFQTLAEVSLSEPFYFMIVSHESRNLFQNNETAKKILDRFVPPIKIELPENMAFKLMAQAMKITSDPLLKQEWEAYKAELNSDLGAVRAKILDGVRKTSVTEQKAGLKDDELQDIIPIHPYAALVLKHLSVAFSSNQRSMFDFIINNDPESKAFKWFIANYGPLEQPNLLTVDMLWDFFYVRGHSGLNDNVRVILDSYGLLNSEKLSPEKQRVLKAILLLQAISLSVADVELLKPNEENIELAFGGAEWSKGKAKALAEDLVRDGLLFKRTLSGGKTEYTVANMTGDAETIRKKKEEVIRDTKTQDLIVTAELLSAITLPAPIAGRYVMEGAAAKNFAPALSKFEARYLPERFKVFVTFAMNDDEASQLKNQIMQAMRSGKDEILYVDAGLTPMGKDLYDQYVESMAYSRYYAQNDKRRSGDFQAQATKCLKEWNTRVAGGAFMLYSKDHPSGIRLANLQALQEELTHINHSVYPYGLEQYNVIANMFNRGPLAQGAECGITQKLAGTFKSPNEKTSLATALTGAWNVPQYWEEPAKANYPIVRIKKEAERLIQEGFAERSGRISVSAIYEALTKAPYGLMPNNISAFVMGFVLKEYVDGNYFWSNGATSENLTTEKLKTAIGNAINQAANPGKNFREEFIVAMSSSQRAFLECTSKAFRIPMAQCGSVESARDQVRISMKRMIFPIWTIKSILHQLNHRTSTQVLSEVIDNYCALANTANGNKGSESDIATAIGKAVENTPAIADDLQTILNSDNCRNGMQAYVDRFDDGILKQLATEIGDNGAYLEAVRTRFNADAANWVWNTETADDKIRDVILDYQIIQETNKTLPKCTSIPDVVRGWNAKTNNIRIAYEAVRKSVGDLAAFLEELYKLKQTGELPDQRKKKFYDLLVTQREAFERFYTDQKNVFQFVASSFLDGLDDSDVDELFMNFPSGQFTKSETEYYKYVEKEVAEYQKGQLKKRIRDLWQAKTGTKDPMDWSSRFDTPILCMFDDEERVRARKVFAIMRDNSPTEADARQVLEYLGAADFYDRLNDAEERDRCFQNRVVGDYAVLLKDPEKVRDYLRDHTSERPYNWMDNSGVQNVIKNYADKLYKTGGYERAWSVVDQMDAGDLRVYLKDLISDNVKVGIEILKNR